MINDSEGYYYYYVVNEKLAARGFGLRYAINFCLHLMKKFLLSSLLYLYFINEQYGKI